MKKRGRDVTNLTLPSGIEIGKRYKVTYIPNEEEILQKHFLLQYGFKPANINQEKAELHVSDQSMDCQITHFRKEDNEKMEFHGVKSSLGSKEMVLQFSQEQNKFQLHSVSLSLLNLRHKRTNEEDVQLTKVDYTKEDQTKKRLSKLLHSKKPVTKKGISPQIDTTSENIAKGTEAGIDQASILSVANPDEVLKNSMLAEVTEVDETSEENRKSIT